MQKHCIFSKSCIPHQRCFSLCNSGTKQPIASIYLLLHNYTSIYRFPVLSQFSQNVGCAGFSLSGSHIIDNNTNYGLPQPIGTLRKCSFSQLNASQMLFVAAKMVEGICNSRILASNHYRIVSNIGTNPI